MALTAAERKANQMARKQEMMDSLIATNSVLTEENAKLRSDLEASRAKVHKMELTALKLQLKAKV